MYIIIKLSNLIQTYFSKEQYINYGIIIHKSCLISFLFAFKRNYKRKPFTKSLNISVLKTKKLLRSVFQLVLLEMIPLCR
jgi:hypothetical protein